MVKKLLFKVFTFWALILTSAVGWGQCPTDPTVNIQPLGSTTICSFEDVSFYVSAFTAGSSNSYTYAWQKSTDGINWSNLDTGSSISTGTSGTTITLSGSSQISNGNKIRIQVAATCDSGDTTVNSNVFTVTVKSERNPEVSISASATTICLNEEISFTSSNLEGGTSPVYEWYVDDASVGNNSPNFTASGLTAGNHTVKVEMTSNATCAQPGTVTSNTIYITVNPLITPVVSITSDHNDICSGEAVTFNATPVDGGSNPQYQWYVGGNPVGSNSASYTTTTLAVGSQSIHVEMTSNIACVDDLQNPAKSNSLSVQVNPLIEPTVTIESDDPDNIICDGNEIIFTATPTNEGSNPTYNWNVNNTVVATTTGVDNKYSINSLNDGDVVSVEMIPDSDSDCPSKNSAVSNAIPITVNPILNPSVTITADKTLICSGSVVNFTSTLTNGGSSPQYQWYVNGSATGTNSPSFNPTNLPVGTAVVKLEVTNNDECVASDYDVITSSIVEIEVVGSTAPQPGIISGATAICPVADDLVYSVQSVSEATSYEWDLPTGWIFKGAEDGSSVTVKATNNSVRGSNFIKVRTWNVCGPSGWQQLLVDVQDFVEVQAGEDQTVCQDVTSIDLTGSASFGNGNANKLNPTWEIVTGGGNLLNPTDLANATYTPGGNDGPNNPVILRIITDQPKGACQAGEDELVINFYEDASVTSISSAFSVCQSGEINLSGTIGGSAETATWTASTGGTFDDANSLTPIFTPDASFIGHITFTLTASGPCSPGDDATDTVMVTVNEASTVNAGEDFSMCSTESIPLNGSSTGANGSGVQWTTSGDGSFGESTFGTSTYSPGTSDIANGTVTLTLTTTNSPDTCEEISDEVVITIYEQPVVTINPDESAICEDETYEITAEVTGDYDTGLWSTSGDGTFNNPGAANTMYTPGTNDITNGTALLKYTIQADNSNCTEADASFSLTLEPLPVIEEWSDQVICSNSTLTLNGANITGGASQGQWEIISGGGSLSSTEMSANYKDVFYTPPSNQAANIVLRLTTQDPEGNCPAVSYDLNLTVNKEPKITTHPSNVGVCSTEPSELSVVATGDNLSYQWYKDGSPVGTNSATLAFSNTTSAQAGTYYVEVFGADFCGLTTSQTVTINVDENIIIEAPARDESVCGNGISEATFEFIAHANGAPLAFTWLKDGVELDLEADGDLTFDTPDLVDGVYTGRLEITNIGNDDIAKYNGNYQVRISGPEGFSCSTAISNNFFLRVNQFPDDPVVEDITYCQFDTPEPLSVVTGTNLKWYASETGDDLYTDAANNPTTPTPDTSIAQEITYWVTQTPDVCESNRVPLKVTVLIKPSVPETETVVDLCHAPEEAPSVTLDATGDYPLNWYNASGDLLGNGAPTPDTQTVTSSPVIYFVSQTHPNGCESELVEVQVNVNALPEVIATSDEAVICEGNSTTLHASGATSYKWYENEAEIGNTVDLPVSPPITTTYTVIGTDEKGCTNTAEVVVNVDPPSDGGFISGPSSICTGGSANITLGERVGEIQRWEKSEDGGAWTEINETSETLNIDNYTTPTTFRAVVKSGVCDEVNSEEISITVDPLPEGGELNWSGVGRVFTICEVQDPGYAVDLTLSGIVGTVEKWEYRASNETIWHPIDENGSDFQGTSLPASKVESLIGNRSVVFRVSVVSGACSDPVYSETAILSIIASDILPDPVEVDPDVICFGEEVTLSAETGYTSGSTISEDGLFDNAGITNNGWRVKWEGQVVGFDTDANNTRPDRWKRATPHPLTTANLTPDANGTYGYSDKVWGSGIEDGNKGFAVVSSNFSSTIETPVFGIDDMDAALLTFDQAYNLTPGASITVLISKDGGATYETDTLFYRGVPADATQGITSGNLSQFALGTIEENPENKIELDLGSYLGESNLRIKFVYEGARIGDVWAIDNIDFADGPEGASQVWTDYTDPEDPVPIGTSTSVNYIPKEVGWNTFEFKTTLVYNSLGESCPITEHAESVKVFAFDQYTVTTTAEKGECGSNIILLSGTVTAANQEEVSYPTADGYIGQWVITGPSGYTLSNANDEIEPINDPNAVFTPGEYGTYSFRWTLTPTTVDENNILIENLNCPPVENEVSLLIEECFALDFDGVDDYVDAGTSYNAFYSLEAWVRPESLNGTIISKRDQHNSGDGYELELNNGKPVFRWNGGVLTSSQAVAINDRWYHLAIGFDGTSATLYVDGIKVVERTTGSAATNSEAPLLIGASGNLDTGVPTNYFSGYIEEVRIWNTEITQEQIRFMMNQRLKNNGTQMGEQIPMDVPDGLSFSNLEGYYRLISANPDPANLVSFATTLMPANGTTPDLAINSVPATLNNMTSNQENTAPLPYFSANDGDWFTDGTWARPEVWDPPYSIGVENDDDEDPKIKWNIARVAHDIKSGGQDIKLLGLLSESNTTSPLLGTLDMEGTNPTSWSGGTGTGNELFISHYLLLDGIIDLNGESQLVQPMLSIVDAASGGHLDRDQQGTASSYNYNYWSSPVGPGASNAAYSVGAVMMDGSSVGNPQNIDFGPSYPYADGDPTTPRKVSEYWLHKFHGTANDYFQWEHIGSTETLNAGEGYSMKGTAGSADILDTQNYTFRGLPNNGDVIPGSTGPEQNYLVGNPYPSAIDADRFIKDNLDMTDGGNTNVFNGTVYFWSHFANKTHYLQQYIGGYAAYNLSGGVQAVAIDERINPTTQTGGQQPQQFIPVGQAFFINTMVDPNLAAAIEAAGLDLNVNGGQVIFKNSQRAFIPEYIPDPNDNDDDPGSVFHSANKKTLNSGTSSSSTTESAEQRKIWLKFKSPKGYHRQILVTADQRATDNFDLGFDAPLIDDNVEDMYWFFNNHQFVIQGVNDFNEDRELKLGVKVAQKGELVIAIDQLSNVPINLPIFLKDNRDEVVHNLRESKYITHSKPGVFTNRFTIIFKDPTAAVIDPEPEEPILTEEGPIEVMYVNNSREVIIKNPELVKIDRVYLNNMAGQQVHVYYNVPQDRRIPLPVKRFSSGVYIVKLHSEKGIITKKVILE